MTGKHAPVLVGLGCSTKADTAEIIALVHACLAEAGTHPTQIIAMASHTRKTGSRALAQTASYFGVPLLFLGDNAVAPDIASTCEAVAAAAGPLRLPKRKSRFATCAIAQCSPGWTPDQRLQPLPASAAMAASTLVTSLAGP